ncbi:hypothetical protein VTP01DRAFT_10507 [Rhizomucor pusillus]|uniref:uncharacterized protein n=1 Tax=Rhizomucor pusillus TaxID=4840 RepID=UPI0037429E05
MSNSVVSHVYRCVIDDVINQVRGEFEDMGIDEAVLQELQRSWETKVARSRVANFGFSEDGYYDEDNGEGVTIPASTAEGMGAPLSYPNVSYAQNAAAAASLASLAAGGNAMRQHMRDPGMNAPRQPQSQQDVYGLANRSMSNIGSTAPSAGKPVSTQAPGNGQLHIMHPQSTSIQLPRPNIDHHDTTESKLHIGRLNIPQNDGSADSELTTEQIDARIADLCSDESLTSPSISFTATSSTGEQLSLDSLPDNIKQLMRDAKARAIKAGALNPNVKIPQVDGEGDDNGEDDINSDLDDSDDADDDPDGGEEIEHIILCLYDKVSRTKNKWKCVLKDGIMLINGRDYLFHRSNGDFEW